MYEPILIAPFENSGLKKWFKPWITGPNAFPQLTDAYARRGVVRKREGMRVLAKLPLESAVEPPVQGLKNWINPSTLGERLIAFSLTKSYLFDDGTQSFNDVTVNPAGTPFSWSNGSNDYFWTSNYAGSMWATNNLTTDHIKYWNLANNWTTIQPILDGSGTTLNAALIILPYKGRLVVLNTTEGTALFPNRARWSQIGTPYITNDATHKPATGYTADPDAWRTDIAGRGGWIDADTSQRIVSAEIVKDTLLVFFQRSTWRLRYTGQEILPFIWERLNTQYGSESTYSNIGFDEAALTFSRYGWIGSDTNDVTRIDYDITDDSFAIEGTDVNITGLNKVQGIRDFFRNFAYWTYIPEGQSICTQIYGYNYLDKSWTIFNPFSSEEGSVSTNGVNCFGSYRATAGDFTWSTMTQSWASYNSPDNTWASFGSGSNEDFPYILGGDLQGNVYLMFEFFQAPTTDNGTPIQFSITSARVNPFMQQGHKARLGYVDIYCTTNIGGEITLNLFVDDQQTPILTRTVEIYSRGVVTISSITVGALTTITTGQNHNLEAGEFATLSDIVGTVGRILNDKTFLVGTAPTPDTFTIQDIHGIDIDTTGYVYSSQGYVYDADLLTGDSTYVRVFLGAIGRMHQIQLTLSYLQLQDVVKNKAQFELQGLVFWMHPTGRVRR